MFTGSASASAADQWPLAYLKATQDWSITQGAGVTVAVIDTGVAPVPGIRANLLQGADFALSDSAGASTGNGQTDLDGHGTQMAVTIAGTGNPLEGLAPQAKILPVRAILEGGAPGGDDSIAAGIRYATSRHVAVISISLTGTGDANLAAAVASAEDAGIVVVAGAGNTAGERITYPAAYPGVVSVGAISQNGTVAPFSQTGPQLALTGPGVNVPVEDDTGATTTAYGTSLSTAYVAATAALIRAAHPKWTAGQVIRDLITTADPGPNMSAGTHSDQYGYGILDPLAALKAPAPGQNSNPLLTPAAATKTAPAPATTATSVPAAANGSSGSSAPWIAVGAILVVILAATLTLIAARRNRPRPPNNPPGDKASGYMPYQPPARAGDGQQPTTPDQSHRPRP